MQNNNEGKIEFKKPKLSEVSQLVTECDKLVTEHKELALAIIAHSESKLSLEYLKEMAKTVIDKLK